MRKQKKKKMKHNEDTENYFELKIRLKDDIQSSDDVADALQKIALELAGFTSHYPLRRVVANSNEEAIGWWQFTRRNTE